LFGLGLRSAKVYASLPAKQVRRILHVRPQDWFEWQLRTNCRTLITPTSSIQVTGSLRVDPKAQKLYFQSGDPSLPKIDDVVPAADLVAAPEASWRLIEVAA
jgi:hypothetical protein